MSNMFLQVGKQRQARQRQKQVDIAEGLSFDTNITSNYILDKKIAQYWEENIKKPWINAMQSKQGAVTPFDKSTLDAQKQALVRMANSGKAFTKNIENMKGMMVKNGGDLYDYDFDEVQRVLQDLDEGSVSLEDFVTTDFASNYDSGMAFVNLKALDPTKLNRIGMDKFKESTAKKGEQYTIETEKGGTKYSTTGQDITYGDYDKWADEMIAGVAARPSDSANYAKGISQSLSDEEKVLAQEKYPKEDISASFLEYYYRDKVRGEWEGELSTTEIGKRSVKPAAKGSGGITFLFGGKKATEEGQISAKATKVEGVPFEEYVEFAKAPYKTKMVKGVTVKGASLLTDGAIDDPEDKTTPLDYEVIGYDKGEDVVFLRNKELTKNGVTHYETYKAPREGNEHFLKGLVSEDTMKELRQGGTKTEGSPKDRLNIL